MCGSFPVTVLAVPGSPTQCVQSYFTLENKGVVNFNLLFHSGQNIHVMIVEKSQREHEFNNEPFPLSLFRKSKMAAPPLPLPVSPVSLALQRRAAWFIYSMQEVIKSKRSKAVDRLNIPPRVPTPPGRTAPLPLFTDWQLPQHSKHIVTTWGADPQVCVCYRDRYRNTEGEWRADVFMCHGGISRAGATSKPH